MSFTERLQGLLDSRGIHYKKGKQSFISDCLNPSCGKEEHMYIRKSDGRSKCFKCGSSWSWKALVAQITGSKIENVHEIFYGEGAGDEVDKPILFDVLGAKKVKKVGGEESKPVVLGMDFVPVQKSKDAVDYLCKRGVTNSELYTLYDLRYQGLLHAVIFPVSRNGTIYGWQARKIEPGPSELRLLSSTSFQKSKFLLNYDRAKQCERIILVEGPFDCLHVDLHGFGAVCSFGKGVSQEQIELLLKSNAKEIYVGLDPDAADEMYEIVEKVGLGKSVFRITPPDSKKDFGECSPEEVLGAVSAAHKVSGQADILEVHLK